MYTKYNIYIQDFYMCCERATQPYSTSYYEMEGEVGFYQALDQQGRSYWRTLVLWTLNAPTN